VKVHHIEEEEYGENICRVIDSCSKETESVDSVDGCYKQEGRVSEVES
jgi:hypothetical protein